MPQKFTDRPNLLRKGRLPEQSVLGEGEAAQRGERGRPRAQLGARRVNPTVAELQSWQAALAALLLKPDAAARRAASAALERMAELAEAKLAEPRRATAGRPPADWIVTLPDQPPVTVTGQAAAAKLAGVKPTSLQVMLSLGNGVARFARRDSNGNPAEATVVRVGTNHAGVQESCQKPKKPASERKRRAPSKGVDA